MTDVSLMCACEAVQYIVKELSSPIKCKEFVFRSFFPQDIVQTRPVHVFEN